MAQNTNLGLVIKYDANPTSLHATLLKAVLERVTLAETHISTHFDRWREAEKYYMLYKKKTKNDQRAKRKDDQEGEYDYRSAVMPYSYAMLLTAHAYMVNVFLNKDPVFQSIGINGGGADKELVMDSMLEYQVQQGSLDVPMLVWLLDVLRYGIGILGNYWDEEFVPQSFVAQEEEEVDGVATGKMRNVLKYKIHEGYKGNKGFNVLPYDFLPDPRVPYCKLQEGEFVGRKLKIAWNELIKKESAGVFFNSEKARELINTSSKGGDRWDNRHESIDDLSDLGISSTTDPQGKKVGDLDAVEMVIEIIPKDWGLGEGEYPEKWVFTVVDKKVIIGCQPLGYLHNMFPYHVLECEPDGYKQESRGMLEIGKPMNDVLSWLFNSHMYNKRQVMDNQFVVDPERVVMKDVTRKDPGKLIRLKPTAFGSDVRTAIQQLPVTDVTNQNYQDAGYVQQELQRSLGINDDISGVSQPSSRRSATEFRGTTAQSANRLGTMAYYFAITGVRSLGRCLISSTQQMYTDEMKVRIAGDAIKSAEHVTWRPEEMAGMYDLAPVDGTLPIDKMSLAQFWQQIVIATAQDPELQMQFRRSDMFSHMARLAGLKNIDRFKMQIVSDEELVAMIKAGQISGNNGRQQQGGEGYLPGSATGGAPEQLGQFTPTQPTQGVPTPEQTGG